MKLTINSFAPVAIWRWNVPNEEVCGICRIPFDGCCPDCRVPGEACSLLWGKCSHVFHLHCINKWLGTEGSRGQCPMDRTVWGMLVGKHGRWSISNMIEKHIFSQYATANGRWLSCIFSSATDFALRWSAKSYAYKSEMAK